MRGFASIILCLACGLASAWEPVILDPKPYTTWTSQSSDGLSKKAFVSVPFVNETGQDDSVNIYRVNLVGSASDRGRAQGQLLANEIVEMVDVAIPEWIDEMIFSFDLGYLPDWLADILKVKVASEAPAALYKALTAVYNKQEQYIPERLIEEMEAIAAGVCDVIGGDCDIAEWEQKVKQVNMLPELIRMTCTMFGAWGPASASSNLIQLRALDFGATPFANYTVLQVHQPTDTAPFASVSFAGMVGVITGINSVGIGFSEKVWMVSNASVDVQPGTYDGEAVVLVSRDVLENAENRQQAEDYMRQANRTWAVFLGIGDFESQQMDIVGYRETDFHAYTPETMPAVTSQPEFDSLVYVDKHPQPSSDTTLPDLLAQYYGNLTIETTAMINYGHTTGDLHIAVYDYGEKSMWVSVGRIDRTGAYGVDSEWKACKRPYLYYNLTELWEAEY